MTLDDGASCLDKRRVENTCFNTEIALNETGCGSVFTLLDKKSRQPFRLGVTMSPWVIDAILRL